MREFVVSVFAPGTRGWLASWTVRGKLSNCKSSARSWWEPDRILVVDDEEAILETMTFTFQNDYEVLTSSDARRALELLDEKAPVAARRGRPTSAAAGRCRCS